MEAPQSCNINRKTARRIKCVAHLGALGPGVRSASIIPCSNAVELSNNIIQKGLAFGREQNGGSARYSLPLSIGRARPRSAVVRRAPPARLLRPASHAAALVGIAIANVGVRTHACAPPPVPWGQLALFRTPASRMRIQSKYPCQHTIWRNEARIRNKINGRQEPVFRRLSAGCRNRPQRNGRAMRGCKISRPVAPGYPPLGFRMSLRDSRIISRSSLRHSRASFV